MRYWILIFSLSVFQGCALVPGATPGLRLERNYLTVDVVLGNRANVAQAKRPYGLFRMVRASEASKGNEVGSRSQYRLGIVRFGSGGGDDAYVVEGSPVALAQPEKGRVRFALPPLGGSSACYAVVSMGSKAMPFARFGSAGSKRLIDLSEFHRFSEEQAELVSLETRAEQAEMSRAGLAGTIQRAREALGQSRAFRAGRCELPATGALPLQPEGSYPPARARELAMQAMFEATVGRVGCQLATRIFQGRSFGSFLKEAECGSTTALGLVPQTQLGVLFNLLETLLLNCSKKGCGVAYSVVVGGRLLAGIAEMTSRLSDPYVAWEREVEELRAEPRREFESCRSNWVVANEFPKRLRALEVEVEQRKAEFDAARKSARPGLELAGGALRCSEPAESFLAGARSGLRYVSPPLRIQSWQREGSQQGLR